MAVVNRVRRSAGHARSAARGIDWAAIDALNITGLVSDSRQLTPGDTFLAYPGEASDGRNYVGHAIERGAASVLWEPAGFEWRAQWAVKNAPVANLRERAGEIASRVYGRPSARLWMVGVTGTNGKTSCSHWIAQTLSRTGRRCGLIGTLGSGWPGKLEPLGNTTPDAAWLQGRLRDYTRQRTRAVCMEVSSHGLAQGRVSGVEFDVALLTNLTRDHLDYHGTMRAYRNAKAQLFRWPTLKWAVVNLDDAFGVSLAKEGRGRGQRVLGYGFNRAMPAALAGRRIPRLVGRKLEMDSRGLRFEVSSPWGESAVRSQLLGRFNAFNLLAALGVLLVSEVPLADAVGALQKVRPVAGRTERYGGGARPLVVIDYAHTPDALENILRALREFMAASDAQGSATARARRSPAARRARRKLVCVFGCGGDRDRGKRPLMGRIASRLADEVIVTSDNPRTEDPRAIIEDVLKGVTSDCIAVEDRSRAINAAIRAAAPGDIVLVAGKGHEQYQEIAGVKHPYSDAAVVREALGEAAA
ncbi:MAG: UDP-N-acetylmuramoyl-L-alanyl-D-glutamate--2,6-diaminopimelate ligase [Burkholderiales bacterium]